MRSTQDEPPALPDDWFTPWTWPTPRRSIRSRAFDIAAGAAFPRVARRWRHPAGLGRRGWLVDAGRRFVLIAAARLVVLPAMAHGQSRRAQISDELAATLDRPPTDREITAEVVRRQRERRAS